MAMFHLEMQIFPYLEMHTGPWNSTPIIVTNSKYHPPIFSSNFSAIWLLFSILEKCAFPYLEMHPGPWKTCHSIVTNSEHHPYFSTYFFCYFIAIFHVEKLIFPYLEMHPEPWKTCPNVVTNSEHHPYFFPYFSAILLPFFIWKSAHFLIWKCALDPEKCAQRRHQQWATPQAHHCKQQAPTEHPPCLIYILVT